MQATKKEPAVIHDTFVLERCYPQSPERVFAALADAAKKRHWYVETETHDVTEFTMDFRVGGVERSTYRLKENTPFPGAKLSTEGIFCDIVTNQRVVQSCTMSFGDRRISSALATFELLPNGTGTDLIFTHQAAFFEGSDGPERRKQGWNDLLDRLGASLK